MFAVSICSPQKTQNIETRFCYKHTYASFCLTTVTHGHCFLTRKIKLERHENHWATMLEYFRFMQLSTLLAAVSIIKMENAVAIES